MKVGSMVGKMLKFMRKSRNYNQQQLGEKINYARNTISQYENGVLQPSFDTIEEIAKECGYIIYFEDTETNERFETKNIDRKDI